MKTFLEFKNTRFFIDKNRKAITCQIDVYINWTKMPFYLYIDFAKCHIYPNTTLTCYGLFTTVIGKAKCYDKDTYDEIKGKRIAECKAKAKALKMYSKIMSIIVADLYINLKSAKELFYRIGESRMKVENHIKKLSE